MNTARYTGMTLTDRLTAAGLLDQFAKALREKDEASTLIILTQVGLTADQARDTIKSFLLDPNSPSYFS